MIYLLILLSVILVYGSSLAYGFSQDDFFFLVLSRASSLSDFFSFFSPWHQAGFPFFRPLGTQVYFSVFVKLFELAGAPRAMHVFMFLVQAGSGYLVYRLLTRLKLVSPLPLMASLLYATSSVHFLSLYYLAATQQLLATFFALLSLNLFVYKRPWPAALALVPALLSKETALVTPALAFLLTQLDRSHYLKLHELRRLLVRFLPYVVIILSYLALRFGAGLTVQSEYHPVVGVSTISTLRWYYLFGYTAPELLLNYSGINLFVNFWRFVGDFGYPALFSTLTTLVLSLTSLVIAIRSLLTNRPLSRLRLSAYILWFVVSIILILFYPDHRYPHYLDLGLIPLLLIVLEGLPSRLRLFAFLLYLVGSVASITLSVNTHWTTGRAKMAERAVSYFATHALCAYDSIYFVGEPAARELSYTLSIENGPHALCYPTSSPRVYYQGVTETPVDPAITIDASLITN